MPDKDKQLVCEGILVDKEKDLAYDITFIDDKGIMRIEKNEDYQPLGISKARVICKCKACQGKRVEWNTSDNIPQLTEQTKCIKCNGTGIEPERYQSPGISETNYPTIVNLDISADIEE